MNIKRQKTNAILQFLPFALFFILGTFYFFGFTSYIFFYQEKSTLFMVSLAHLYEHINQPGGFLTYLGEMQTSFYFYPLAGAVIVAFEICAVIFILTEISAKLSKYKNFFLPFIIGGLLFYLQTPIYYL